MHFIFHLSYSVHAAPEILRTAPLIKLGYTLFLLTVRKLTYPGPMSNKKARLQTPSSDQTRLPEVPLKKKKKKLKKTLISISSRNAALHLTSDPCVEENGQEEEVDFPSGITFKTRCLPGSTYMQSDQSQWHLDNNKKNNNPCEALINSAGN